MIDYKNYLDLDTEDLEKLVTHAKNIIHLRIQDEVAAINACDSEALLKTFTQNTRRLLSDKAWKALDIDMIPFDKVSFFELVRTLPQYQKKNEDYLKDNYQTYEQKLATKSLYDIDYLNYCLDSEEYRPFILKMIEDGDFMRYIKQEDTRMIDLLVQKELVKPDNDIFTQINQWLQTRGYNVHHYAGYLEYAITRHDVQLPVKEAQMFFKKNWNSCSFELNTILKEQYCSDVKMNLDEAMQTYKISVTSVNEMANYKDLVKTSKERFADIIGMFELTPNTVFKMMQNLRNILNNKDNDKDGEIKYNMAQLFTHVHHHLPEAQNIITECASDDKYPRFKQLASRMMLYVQLDEEIPMNEMDDDEVNAPRSPKI